MGKKPRNPVVWAAAWVAVLASARTLAPAATVWLGAPYSVSIPTHISGAGQCCTGSSIFPLQHDVPCTIGVTVDQPGDEILHNGTNTLLTSYKITGIASGDADWVDAVSFLTHTYFVPGTNTTNFITLSVRAMAPTDQAPDAGTYSATIILTATW